MAAVAKIDSKGRVSLPREIREILGKIVEIRPVGKRKVLLSPARKGTKTGASRAIRQENFLKLLDKEPKRTGKPENPSPEQMKAIWNE
jgi:bifunctional DNA-binding transcriptional regulator/antitoxin component of YhaV-PrlF toxin-antitoxin module